jgi:hypothetical protein
VQYTSEPDWPWFRTRKETPGHYETYADMETGAWVHLKIVLRGVDAQIHVGGATQPTLLVKGLKLGDVFGGVALFVGPGTDGYFKNLRIAANRSEPWAEPEGSEVCSHQLRRMCDVSRVEARLEARLEAAPSKIE